MLHQMSQTHRTRIALNLLRKIVAQNDAMLKHLATLSGQEHPVVLPYVANPENGNRVDPETGKKVKYDYKTAWFG